MAAITGTHDLYSVSNWFTIHEKSLEWENLLNWINCDEPVICQTFIAICLKIQTVQFGNI